MGSALCIGIGGGRVDRAVAAAILDAVSNRAIEAAVLAADQADRAIDEVRQGLSRELEAARYEAGLAARRYELRGPSQASRGARTRGTLECGLGEGGLAGASRGRSGDEGRRCARYRPGRADAAGSRPSCRLERTPGRTRAPSSALFTC